MEPLIKSGQLVTVKPLDDVPLAPGDIVLCKVRGNQYLHKVLAVKGKEVLIGNNRGHTNGWTTQVYGRYVK